MPATMKNTAAGPASEAGAEVPETSKGVQWIDRNMATHFANVVNVQSTREQVDLFLGTNKTWNVGEGQGMAVELSNRVILTPHAAKRLWSVLGSVLKEYEARYGTLNLER